MKTGLSFQQGHVCFTIFPVLHQLQKHVIVKPEENK
jgi:hypothetical protein